jgi:hypothetical protein
MSIFNKKVKGIIGLIAGLFLASIVIIVGFNTIKTTMMNLENSEKISGIVENYGITNKSSIVSGRYKVDSKVFFIKINSSDQIFGVYNKEQDYSDLANLIKIQDSIFINYLASSDRLNIDVLQITKDNNVIYGFDKFKSKERIGGLIALAGGFLILILVIYGYKKDYVK